MNTLKNIALMAYAVAALSGCEFNVTNSDRIDPSQIYQSYRLTHYGDSGTTYSVARYLVGGPGGNTVDLIFPSRVTFDGYEMKKEAFLGLDYNWSGSLAVAGRHYWNFTDRNGRGYSNEARLVPIEIGSISLIVFANVPFTIPISGAPIGSGERVTATLSSANVPSVFVSSTVPGATSVTVDASQLQTLPSGSVQVRLRRSQTFRLSDATAAGGDIQVEYESSMKYIQITR